LGRLTAVTRGIDDAITRCQLTHLDRQPIDVDAARRQHEEYEACLRGLECEVVRLPADPALPDAVFVEDTAVVLDEVAVLARPGAAARGPEIEAVEAALAPHRELLRIEAPGTLDGGDVLVLGREIFVGRSSRTNEEGIERLRRCLEPFSYTVRPVNVEGCLHLKSAITRVGPRRLLVNPDWVEGSVFQGYERIPVDPGEPFAANALLVRETVVFPAAFQRTRVRLEGSGSTVVPVDVSELAKAEGGVTCCSLIFAT